MKSVPYRTLLGSLIFLSTRTRPISRQQRRYLGNIRRIQIIHIGNMSSNSFVTSWVPYPLVSIFRIRLSKSIWKIGWMLIRHATQQVDTGDLDIWLPFRIFQLSGCPSCKPPPRYEQPKRSSSRWLNAGKREMFWIRELLTELHAPQPNPTVMHQDNYETISWTKKVQSIRRLKHIGIKYRYVRDAVQSERYNSSLFHQEKTVRIVWPNF